MDWVRAHIANSQYGTGKVGVCRGRYSLPSRRFAVSIDKIPSTWTSADSDLLVGMLAHEAGKFSLSPTFLRFHILALFVCACIHATSIAVSRFAESTRLRSGGVQ